jgi:hypothetical protein
MISAFASNYSRRPEKFDRRAVPQRNKQTRHGSRVFEARMARSSRRLAIRHFTVWLLL